MGLPTGSTDRRERIRGLGQALAVAFASALAYVAMAEAPALAFSGASPFWPPAALAVFLALRGSRAGLIGVFAGALFSNTVLLPLGAGAALIGSAGNALAPLAGLWLMRRLGVDRSSWWTEPRGVFGFLLGMGLVQATLSAVLGVGALVLFGRLPTGAAAGAMLGWTVGDASAAVMLAPLLQLAWTRVSAPSSRGHVGAPAQVIGVFAASVAVWALVFESGVMLPVQRMGLLGLLLLPCVWSTFALDAVVSAALLAFIFLLVISSAMVAPQVFGGIEPGQGVVGLELFMITAGGSVLIASALQSERRAAMRGLHDLTAALDARAEERARTLVEQEREFRGQIVRLSELTTILSRVNQVIARAQDEAGLLQTFCELVAELQGVALAWIGRPGPDGRFQVLARAGRAVTCLEGPDAPTTVGDVHGDGPAARVWREGRAVFAQRVDGGEGWQASLAAAGVRGMACLPLFRRGEIWAEFHVYVTAAAAFDLALQELANQIAVDISLGLDRIEALQQERQTSSLNEALLANVTVGIVVMRYPERIMEHVNARLLQMAGAGSLADMAQRPSRDFYSDEATYQRIGELARQVLREGHGTLAEVPYRQLDGTMIRTDLSGARLDLGDGAERILWTQIDVSERFRQAQELRRLTASRDALLANTVAAIDMVRYPDRIIVEVNKGFLEVTGFDSPADIVGQSTAMIYAEVKEDRRMAELSRQILETGEGKLTELQVKRRDGRIIYVDVHGRRLEGDDADHPLIVWTSIDVTERHALTQELNRLAMFDALTGLPNRRAVEQHLTLAIDRARRHGNVLAVGMIDLDDFKPINDRFGHQAGDLLLRQVSERLEEHLRSTDLVGRFGGDEFVVIFEDLDPAQFSAQLGLILKRLHEAVDAAFDIGGPVPVRVEMSMGLGLYPQDSELPDALLRVADAAMYQAKAHKSDRMQWWSLGDAAPETVKEEPFDPFSSEAQRNLVAIQPQLDAVADGFSRTFYAELGERSEGAEILGCLDAAELAALKAAQAGQLRFLLDPATTASQIAGRGAVLGRIHALTGISGALMSNAFALYRELLRWHLDAMNMATRVRYRTLRAADERLQLDTQSELDAMQEVVNLYNEALARPAAPSGTWVEFVQIELEAVASLPGVRSVVLMRPRTDGYFEAEMVAGDVGVAMVREISDLALRPSLNAQLPTGGGLSRAAWVSGNIERIDAYGHDPRSLPWAPVLKPLGVRSMVAVPVLGQRSEFILLVSGAYRHQFAPAWMQTFLMSLQNRWLAMARQPIVAVAGIERGDVARYRELLYTGNLRMFVQPIVDVRSGRTEKVEALARLTGDEGRELIPPAAFLPALRGADLDALFRSGLALSLGQIRRWRDDGLDLSVAVNLPPSTLVHPDCPQWIEEALREFDIAPERLTLELVESQEFDELRRDEAIEAIERLGVKLAIDDLGSGYSSLNRLASLPFDVIKVDQGITREIDRSPIKTLSLIRTVVQIGIDFEREVVVEGAETQAVVEAVRILGARYVQGYAIARPMPGDELPGWMREQGRRWSDDGSITTWLGALAYQWSYMHVDEGRYPTSHGGCPLTALFERQGLGDSDAATWHRDLHVSEDEGQRRGLHANLLAWLLQRTMQPA